MERKVTTHDNLPQMVELLMQKIEGLEIKIDALTPNKTKKTTIDIDAAAEFTQKAKSTIYKLVRSGGIPAYKRGKKLYFVKEELEEWLTKMPNNATSIFTNDTAMPTTASNRLLNPRKSGRKRNIITI
ncbi:MAG: helix-turn-helix domain-containing protein [Rikenellaceae bacterium]